MSDTATTYRAGPRAGRDRHLVYAEAPRALAEATSLIAAAPYLSVAPFGDRHPVMVLPGYGGDDASTAVIRHYLASRSLSAVGWSLGRNRGSAMPELRRRLGERLHAVWQEGDRRTVSLVGWSLGGVYARWLAHSFPERVRQVITLGSPIGGIHRADDSVPGREDGVRLRTQARDPLPGVPGSALYSRTDGIVPWQIARQQPSAIAENVEVYGSHIGLGFNASVLYLLAERLAQADGEWLPFQRNGWKRWVYGPDRS